MNFTTILKQYGLTEKQAKIYLACLELGAASVQKISHKAGLARSTTYEILEYLQRQGFVTTFRKKKSLHFSAEEPERLLALAKNKITTLEQALPELRAISGEARIRPTVRFYQGIDGMKIVLEEILAEAKELQAFGSADDLFRTLPDFHKFVEKRKKKKIPVRVILRDSEKARERQQSGQKDLRVVRLISDQYQFHGLIYVWNNKIAQLSFQKDLVALVIESEVLADTQRAMFESLWDSVE
ncbi:helix-turn-helix domain-containing protein [Patescibacteria group bacterium]|nr:helix-turn-helix domain-containing protein [Patescibacteria group bacterium]